ncbi:hypothetical protein C8R45DRAFT_1096784 [Mycena sanguinolenta]|nr:hypothetical protein C8R45DRAFT_1096784 [Mycena sanguinolenta]
MHLDFFSSANGADDKRTSVEEDEFSLLHLRACDLLEDWTTEKCSNHESWTIALTRPHLHLGSRPLAMAFEENYMYPPTVRSRYYSIQQNPLMTAVVLSRRLHHHHADVSALATPHLYISLFSAAQSRTLSRLCGFQNRGIRAVPVVPVYPQHLAERSRSFCLPVLIPVRRFTLSCRSIASCLLSFLCIVSVNDARRLLLRAVFPSSWRSQIARRPDSSFFPWFSILLLPRLKLTSATRTMADSPGRLGRAIIPEVKLEPQDCFLESGAACYFTDGRFSNTHPSTDTPNFLCSPPTLPAHHHLLFILVVAPSPLSSRYPIPSRPPMGERDEMSWSTGCSWPLRVAPEALERSPETAQFADPQSSTVDVCLASGHDGYHCAMDRSHPFASSLSVQGVGFGGSSRCLVSPSALASLSGTSRPVAPCTPVFWSSAAWSTTSSSSSPSSSLFALRHRHGAEVNPRASLRCRFHRHRVVRLVIGALAFRSLCSCSCVITSSSSVQHATRHSRLNRLFRVLHPFLMLSTHQCLQPPAFSRYRRAASIAAHAFVRAPRSSSTRWRRGWWGSGSRSAWARLMELWVRSIGRAEVVGRDGRVVFGKGV